ncbi:focadhesin-like [Seriola lalandi dorsalis]|uniref:focadhesin-like n=1 Tax=Seriola lalandi dorsalis TaxID=1841481 RepID=UPI000C6FC56F|nr:focadhesin-like [Seriola lalandi dorsalis]
MPLLYGIRAQWFPWQQGSKPRALQHSLYGEESLTDHALPQCLLGMPHSLALLLGKEPWSSQTQKFIDWLLSITEAPGQSVSTATTSTAKGEDRKCSNSYKYIQIQYTLLRHSSSFKCKAALKY